MNKRTISSHSLTRMVKWLVKLLNIYNYFVNGKNFKYKTFCKGVTYISINQSSCHPSLPRS